MEHGVRRQHGLVWVALLGGGLVAGCGGGSDGSGGGTDTTNDPVVISRSTAGPLTAQSLDAAGAGSAAGAGTSVLDQKPQAARAAAKAPVWTTAIAQAVRRVAGADVQVRPAGLASAANVSIGPNTIDCSDGGTVTATGSVALEGAISDGDQFTLVFDGCTESYGTLDGRLDLGIVSINPAGTLRVIDTSAIGLMLTVGRLSETVDGDLRVTIDNSVAGEGTIAFRSDVLGFTRRLDGSVRSSRRLNDYRLTSTTDTDSGDNSLTFSYSVSGDFPRLGEVSWAASTTRPLLTLGDDEHPSSGRIEVDGADDGVLEAVATEDGVDLAIDEDGDGVIDATRSLTWDQLDGYR